MTYREIYEQLSRQQIKAEMLPSFQAFFAAHPDASPGPINGKEREKK